MVVAVVRTRVNLAAIWDIVESDAGSVGVARTSFLVDDYGIRLASPNQRTARQSGIPYLQADRADRADTVKKLVATSASAAHAGQARHRSAATLKTALDSLPRGASGDAAFAFGAGSASSGAS